MYKGFLITHQIVVTLFFLIYVIKTVLLLSNKQELLQRFTKIVKVPEMIVSAAFLVTGVYLLTTLPSINILMWIKIGLVLLSIPVAVIGFKKSNKGLAALSLLLITASYGIAEASKAKREKASAETSVAASNIDGKELYTQLCVSCHGNDGKAGASGASDLSKTALDNTAMAQIILKGKEGTMMLPQAVTNEQAAAIADYVSVNIKGK
ncbi:MAG: cytochrome c [Bacteroidetes bacterium]|nr:cytochrome c [Bacteroidota bacterium]